MISYKVYLTDRKNNITKCELKSKEEVENCVTDANKKGYYSFSIIMNIDGTDKTIKRGIFSNKDDKIEIPELKDKSRVQEWNTETQKNGNGANSQDIGER